jgi:hypothetical protein
MDTRVWQGARQNLAEISALKSMLGDVLGDGGGLTTINDRILQYY